MRCDKNRLLFWLLPFFLTFPFGCGNGGSSSGDGGTEDGTHGTDQPNGDQYCPVVGYAPCGGDVLGTWQFRALCPDDPEAAAALCEHPYDDQPTCTGEGNEAICDGSISGTLTFHDDLSLEVSTHNEMVTTWHFTDECLAAGITSGSTAEERCLSMSNDHLTCTYQGSCTCVSDPMIEDDSNTGTYAISGNEITLGDDPPSTYCIDGELLTMDYYLYHPVSWRYWVLERQ